MPSAGSVRKENKNEIKRLVNDIQDGIIENIQKQLKDDDINFTGDMSNSFTKGTQGDFATVETDNKYAGFIEFGMPAGERVDFNALRIWVEHKLGIPEGDELTATTHAIYNAIIKNGIQPRRFMKKAIRKFIGLHGTTSIKSSTNSRKNKDRKSTSFSGKIKKAIKGARKLIRDFKSSKMVKKVG